MALNPGDIAFVGFNADGNDNLAFVALTDIAGGEVILFEDNEWNGTGWNDTNEGAFSWTATNLIPAGTIIRIDNIGSGTITASMGTVTAPVAGRGSNRGIAANDEVIYAYQGSAASPTFLSAIANSGFTATTGLLTNTGLTAGVTAIDLSTIDTGADIAVYAGSRTGQTSYSAYLPLINDATHWISQDASGDQSIDGTAPDLPFSSTAFTTGAVLPTVTIAAANATAAEVAAGSPADIGTFRISRTGDTTTAIEVSYTITGTATNGTDYTSLPNTVTIPAGAAFVDLTVAPVDDTDVEGNETVSLTLASSANYTVGTAIATVAIADNDLGPGTIRIHDIQGAGHRSPFVGQAVQNVQGIVTAIASNGFYIQDPDPDNNEATSEGVFVFTGTSAAGLAILNTRSVGEAVLVSGTVSEFRPGGSANNLTITQIGNNSSVQALSVNAWTTAPTTAIAPTILGNGGRAIPTQVISSDSGNVETSGTFNPAQDGIDFYESLEGMVVQINNAVTTSPTANFGSSEEIWVLADNGANATSRTANGGSLINPTDFNPERIQIDDLINGNTTLPAVNVGTQLSTITGVVNYDFNNYEVLVASAPTVVQASPLQKEITNLTGTANQLTVATFNVENLDPGDGAAKFNALAQAIVNNLQSPDILSLEEIQDNNGATNDSVVDASDTFQALIAAIAAAGGPTYEYRQINPVDDQDGGEPGGNIRVGFLFNPNRVGFVEGSLQRLTDTNLADGDAFASSRKPLVGTFTFNGQPVTVIGNHFNSKGGDQPLFGPNQPPTLSSEVQRNQQAILVSDYVQNLLASNPNANVVVAGDLNDFEFSNPLTILENSGLNTLVETLPQTERYTYNFQGNAQVLDQILVSNNLFSQLDGFDVVHINSEFADQVSDHDPTVARFNLPSTPPVFQLQLLHYYGESGLLGVQTAPIMGALIDKFDDQYANTLVLGEGDSYIPGPWLIGGADPSLNAVPGIGSTALGRPDIAIMNAFGTDASALGNHEFDLGSPVLQGAIAASGTWVGAQFPLLTANLNFAADASLRGLADASLGGTVTNNFAGQEASAIQGKIAPYAVVTQSGQKIGIVGATTYDLLSKSSPNGTVPKDDGIPSTDDLQEVAAYIQAAVNALQAQGVNKIIMVDQLDTLDRNKALAPLVSGIDVMVAGGGHERMGDATDTAVGFNGHTADFIPDAYPIVATGADGKPTLIVTTDTEYTYLGRLVVDFDANGEIVVSNLNPAINGAYASTEATLQAAYGTTDSANQIIASSTIGTQVKSITDAINNVILTKDSQIWGYTNVYLEGDRAFGRVQEVNLGNITADANLYAAQQALGGGFITSLKNGGGLRASIGSIDEDGSKIAPIANPVVGKPTGAISTLDIENALRFDNKLMVFDTPPQGLKNILEFAAGLSSGPNQQNGGYMQIGGIRVSYDATQPAGSKVQSIALTDLNGNVTQVVYGNGAFFPTAPATIQMVALNFTANGGDGYPIKVNGTNFRYLLNDGSLSAPISTALDFTAAANVPANALGEQQAFKDYLQDFYATPATAYGMTDTPTAQDERIQQLSFRADTVLLAPTDIALGNSTIAENSANNTMVGTLTATDPNSTMGFTFSLLDNANGRFAINGDQLVVANGSLLDYEANTSHQVTVRVTDVTGAFYDESLAIAVTNVNEAPTANNDGGFTANQSAAKRIPIATLLANDTDPDANTTLSILPDGFSDAMGGSVALDGSDVLFTPDSSFSGTARFKYTVSDGSLTSQATVTIEVGMTTNGGNGKTTLNGSNGDDVLSGGNGKDTLVGLAGNDTLIGGNGNDSLVGGSGDDVLIGGNGHDTLTGSTGRDRFVYNAFAERTDTITDFNTTEDSLDLKGVFSYLGSAPVTNSYVRFQQSGANTLVQVDLDGAVGGANFSTLATLTGVTATNLAIGANVIV